MLSCLGFTTRWLVPVQLQSPNDAMDCNSHAAGTRTPRPAQCGHLRTGTGSRHEPPIKATNVKPPLKGGAGLIGSAIIRRALVGAPETETCPEPPCPDAGNFVRTLSGHRGLRVGGPDGNACRNGGITPVDLARRAALFSRCIHGQWLEQLRAKP